MKNFKKNESLSLGTFKDDKYSSVTYQNTDVERLTKKYDFVIKEIMPEKFNDRITTSNSMRRTCLNLVIFDDLSKESAEKILGDKKGIIKKLEKKFNNLIAPFPVFFYHEPITDSNDKVKIMHYFNIGLLTKKEVIKFLSTLKSEHKYICDDLIKDIVSLHSYRIPQAKETKFLEKLNKLEKSLSNLNSDEVEDLVNKMYAEAESIDFNNKLEYLLTYRLANKLSYLGFDGLAIAVYSKIASNCYLGHKSNNKIGHIIYNQATKYEKSNLHKHRDLLKRAFRYFANDEEVNGVLISKILNKLSFGKDSVQDVIHNPIDMTLHLADKCFEANQKLLLLQKKYNEIKSSYENYVSKDLNNKKFKVNKFKL